MIEVGEGRAHTFELYVDAAPTSATVAVKTSAGGAVTSGSATVDAVSTTVSTVTSQTQWTLASGTGIVEGRRYLVAGGGNEVAQVTCESITGAVFVALDQPHFTVAAADTVKGCRLTFALGAAYTGTRGVRYRVEWTVTHADGSVVPYQTLYSVVRMVFRAPMTASRARQFVATAYASLASRWASQTQRWSELAEQTNRMVYRRLLEAQYQPPMIGADEQVFEEAGLTALQIALARLGFRPADKDQAEYIQELRVQLGAELTAAVAGLWYDADDDAAVSGDEEPPRSMRWVR